MFRSTQKKENTMNFDLEYIEKLVKMVSDSELTELTLEEKESAIVIRKEKEVVQAQTIVPQAIAAPATAPAPVAAPVAAPAPAAAPAPVAGDGTKVPSPMPGTILSVNVSVGQAVKSGEVLLVLEAMKMENDIVAPCDGTVKQLLVSKGSTVNTDDVLVVM